jgi:hypothetical protein
MCAGYVLKLVYELMEGDRYLLAPSLSIEKRNRCWRFSTGTIVRKRKEEFFEALKAMAELPVTGSGI